MDRRLAAILAADVVGYSTLMEKDEAGTYARLKGVRNELVAPEVERHHGRIFKLMGDGFLAEFASVVDAVECAVALQRGLAERNEALAENERFKLRIGINLGEVIVEGDDRYGEGVNVAVRLEQLADPGGVFVSGKVAKEVEKKLAFGFEALGEQKIKNLDEPISVFRVSLGRAKAQKRLKPARTGVAKSSVVAGLVSLVVMIAVGGFLLNQRFSGPVGPPLPDKPSIVVLPFANLSDDPQQTYFADGIAEDLMTDLSRHPGLFVIARNSAFAYRGQNADLRKVGRELGVRYIVEGSVRRAGEQVRVNIQLIDSTSGGHVWAEKYDGSMADVFVLQDHITKSVVDALALKLTPDATQALGEKSETAVPLAYDAFLRGWELYQLTNPTNFSAAIPHFEQAIALDPTYARAHAALAMIYFTAYDEGWSRNLGMSADDAFRKARDHLALANTRPTSTSHQVAANIYRGRGWYENAVKEFRAAIALDPSDSWSYAYLSYSLIYAGRATEAEEQIETAIRLDPQTPPLFLFYRGLAQFEQNRMEEAAATLKEAVQLNPDYTWPHAYLAASYSYLGREKEGADAIAAFNAARLRQGGVPLVIFQLTADEPEYRPPPGSPLIRGLLQIGVPQNFDAPAFDALRLSAQEIEQLFFGHRLHGHTAMGGVSSGEWGLSVAMDGTASRFGVWGSDDGVAKVEDHSLCILLSTTNRCANILRNPGGSRVKQNEYIWFDGWVYAFSQIE